MKFTAAALAACVSTTLAFTLKQPRTAFVSTQTAARIQKAHHGSACGCGACTGWSCGCCTSRVGWGCGCCTSSAIHKAGCSCASCSASGGTRLYSTTEETTEAEPAEETAAVADVPPEVEALDGIESKEEAHNAERPARKSLKKKSAKKLSEFSVGDTVNAKCKSITAYGAFMDIGAETDGLLHISALSVDYVSSVGEILSENESYDVRIIKIDPAKKQIGLSLLTEEQEANQKAAAPPKREPRRDDRAVLSAISSAGWDKSTFIKGTVVKTVDFGAFVSIDVSQLGEFEGKVDGLVHISAMANKRVNTVTDVVKEQDEIQVRLKSIDDRKVSLSMVSIEDEQAKQEARGGSSNTEDMGNKDWKEDLTKFESDSPVFKNTPLVVDLR